MFAAPRNALNAYRSLGVETSMVDASPHRLIAMLFEGALESIARARGALERRDTDTRAKALNRAVRIIDEGLKASLDPAGGEMSTNLRNLYQYISQRLLAANLRGDAAALDEAARLLTELSQSWQGIAKHPATLAHGG